MGNKKHVTLNIEKEILDKIKKFCLDNKIYLSTITQELYERILKLN